MPANIVADARPAARLFLNRTRCPDAHDEIAKRSPRSPPGGVRTEGLSDIQSSINFRGPATQPGRMLWGYAEPIELSRATMFLARSEEHTSELQSLMRIPYAVYCLNTQ